MEDETEGTAVLVSCPFCAAEHEAKSPREARVIVRDIWRNFQSYFERAGKQYVNERVIR